MTRHSSDSPISDMSKGISYGAADTAIDENVDNAGIKHADEAATDSEERYSQDGHSDEPPWAEPAAIPCHQCHCEFKRTRLG